jgi:hypothetical protein
VQDRRRRPDERVVDCVECKNGSEKVPPKFNQRRGRHCFKFSKPEVRADLIKIEYDGRTEAAKDREGLVRVLDLVADFQKAEGGPGDFESLLKGTGMCIWSFPFSEQEHEAYHTVHLCATSGMGLTYPHPDLGPDDQPNLFFEYLQVYSRAKSEYAEAHRGSEQ